MQHDAVYIRVSGKAQDFASQLPDLERWAAAQGKECKYYRDRFSGRTMERPGWSNLWAAVERDEVSRIVVWRLDRLGRTAAGLSKLFNQLQTLKIGLVSLKDSIDLSTPSGRLIAHILGSVAEYENEVRADRIRAGQAAAKSAGKTIGGRRPGTRIKLSLGKEEAIKRLYAAGTSITQISKAVELSRPTVYRALKPSVHARA